MYRTIFVLLFVDSSEDSLQHCTRKSSTAASRARLSAKTKTVVIPVSKTVGSERLLGEADSIKLLAANSHTTPGATSSNDSVISHTNTSTIVSECLDNSSNAPNEEKLGDAAIPTKLNNRDVPETETLSEENAVDRSIAGSKDVVLGEEIDLFTFEEPDDAKHSDKDVHQFQKEDS